MIASRDLRRVTGLIRSSSSTSFLRSMLSGPEKYLPPLEEALSEEDIIERKRRKSRLNSKHYKIHHHQAPQLTADEKVVESLRKQRVLYGKYGEASGVDTRLLWPSKEELALEKEWEGLAYPHTVHEMIATARKEREQEREATMKRQEDILRKVAKLEEWKREVTEKIAKQEKEAHEAKEKKERLIDEVRQMLGFRIDPRDDRFKEALERKEAEERKQKKQAKKLAKQQNILERLKRDAKLEADGEEAKKSEDVKEQ